LIYSARKKLFLPNLYANQINPNKKMMDKITEFNEYRSKMNERIFEADNLLIKRFFNLDTHAYTAGSLNVKTKEMIGLACSMVLRCDDCIKYHIGKCKEEGLSKEEFFEVFSIALLIGGSIVIPHLRRAVEYLEEFDK
jgi:AhpD family alkylhydroperoxidase